MSVFRTSNPLLTANAFGGSDDGRYGNFAVREARPGTMTLQGAVNATAILLGLTVAAGILSWVYLQKLPALMFPAFIGGSILALVLTLVASFKPKLSPYLGPVIAVAEGLFAGAASIFWTRYAAGSESEIVGSLGTGLVLQAALLTVGVAGGLLLAYKTRLIRATENFKLGIMAATTGLCFFSLIAFALSMFGIRIPYIWDNGPIGLIFSGAIVVLAALNLVLDFDFIEKGAERGLPKHMEWFAGIGLLVTLVWLYVSLLRLLAQLQRRD